MINHYDGAIHIESLEKQPDDIQMFIHGVQSIQTVRSNGLTPNEKMRTLVFKTKTLCGREQKIVITCFVPKTEGADNSKIVRKGSYGETL
jgi:hypothetical protein